MFEIIIMITLLIIFIYNIILPNNNISGGGKKIIKKSSVLDKYILEYIKNKKGPYYIRSYVNKNENNTTKLNKTHKWYKYKNWNTLICNQKYYSIYISDILYSKSNFLFNWHKVFNVTLPLMKKESNECIGVLRCENDGKTLFVYKHESSNDHLYINKSYSSGISNDLIEKYTSIPGYFLFHTHPRSINSHSWPSDEDIFLSLIHCYENKYVGHVVISENGAIVYFIDKIKIKKIRKNLLKFYYYCYDFIMAWNAFNNSAGPINENDTVNFAKYWNFNILVIPSPLYISKTFNKYIEYNIIEEDKFIHTKYSFLDYLKDLIKIEESEKNN